MIQLKHISHSFPKNDLFKDFNLEIAQGEFLILMGDNGAGKSTVCNFISGKIIPDSGQVLIAGKDVTALTEYKRAQDIAYVFQDPKAGTNAAMSVRENLSLALNKGNAFSLKRAVVRSNDEKFVHLLSELDMGLENCLGQSVASLSGGQRQALSLIMATLNKPKILLLDEHTAALDPNIAKIILSKTREIATKSDFTTVMITHNIPAAVACGDRLIFLRQGRIRADFRGEAKAKLTVGDVAELFE